MTSLQEQIALAIDHLAVEYSREYKPSVCEDAEQGFCHHDAARTAYAMAAHLVRDFTPVTPVTADDCAICNNPRDGRHDDHHYRPRLPPEEWARPTPEQRELMRLEAQRIERERTTALNQEEA